MASQSKDDDISKSLAKLAMQIANAAMDEKVSLSEKIEAFKVLGNFHIGTTRVTKNTATESQEFTTFGDLKESMRQAD
jgi:poly-gamma-glutamate capsule biosynthesis protein CapA/YwtB (metallophosphatase superfamily)